MTENNQLSQPSDGDEEISLLDLAIVLAKYKKWILGLPVVVAVLSAAVALLLPNVYTATTRILPPQQGQSGAAAMMSQLGGLAAAAGGGVGLKNPADLYVGMLKSRTIADNLITRFGLNEIYESNFQSRTRNELSSNTTISAGKDGIIIVEFDDNDPGRAAEIANAYVDELFKLNKSLAVTEASQRRLFFEKQFEQARDNLVKAEVTAREAISEGGLIKVDDQGKTLVETTARLRAAATVKEVQIGAMRSYAADKHPQLLAAQQELAIIKNELAKIEGQGEVHAAGDTDSTQGMKNLGLLRAVKYHEAIYELMAKQFEAAKIDEAKDPSIIQVVDKAVVPDRKSKPKRRLMVLLSALAAGFVAVLGAFVKESMEKARQKPETAERWATFRRHMVWRKG